MTFDEIVNTIPTGLEVKLGHHGGDKYGYELEGTTVYITIPGHIQYPHNEIKKIIRNAEGLQGPERVTINGISASTALELLFNHYRWGTNDKSNCVLVGADGQIIGVSYNGAEETTVIYSDIFWEDGIVINNKKQIKKVKIYLEELDKLLSYLEKNDFHND